ncbi:carcinoembryonic antigen-related cell adhesion molecule 21 [Heterocephalus glaber]|uniref:Carcinoembryonic antigen-related cell adhesion molecule 21 n=1 Tax=Heterocephalus glaber TaxID=10181 RepID=A0AAX6SL64_HETGA|nr:carcinoembryonic antigen-related cell adhesion molecule 21 [Heterocephalus glaber]XP_021109578.1 carcinoembryonic antigen-related cell adhesion molecule 21 [Heterocephalus glaber]
MMEMGSATSHRGFVPWQVLLLTASVLIFWNTPTTAKPTIEAVPFNAAEGGSVVLVVRNVAGKTRSYLWYKGDGAYPAKNIAVFKVSDQTTTHGPLYNRRQKIFLNGSMMLDNLNKGDLGVYTIRIIMQNFMMLQATGGQFHLYRPVSEPTLESTHTSVRENDSVILTCLSSDPGISIRWFFTNQIVQVTGRKKLSPNNVTFTIDPFKKEDAGEYQCVVSNPVSSRKSGIIRLSVKPNIRKKSPGRSQWGILPIVVGVMAGVALMGALACFLFFKKKEEKEEEEKEKDKNKKDKEKEKQEEEKGETRPHGQL